MGRQSSKFALEKDLGTLVQINRNSDDIRIQKAIELILRFGPKYLNLNNMSRKDSRMLVLYKAMLDKIFSLRTSELAQLGAEVAFCARKAGDLETADKILSNFPHYFWY